MGGRILYIKGLVKRPKGKQVDVKFRVDSGTKCSVLPKEVWQAACLKPKRKMTFALVFNLFQRPLQPMRMLLC